MIAPFQLPDVDSIPHLRNGDRLSMQEFERRWDATPNLKRAELIAGQVFLSSSSGHWTLHAEPLGRLLYVLASYSAALTSVSVGVTPSIRMEAASMPQPDCVMRIDEMAGGSSRITDGFLVGGPEFIGEVSGTDEAHDLCQKKSLYERAGVQEYLNWNQSQKQIFLFSYRSGAYSEIRPTSDRILKSEIFPGLWFDSAALLESDRERITKVSQAGVTSPEYHQFARSQIRRISAVRKQP